jgi:uncharacterized protein affecting Mg2+/Co2+ transport
LSGARRTSTKVNSRHLPAELLSRNNSINDVVLTQLTLTTLPKSSGITKLPNGQTQIGGEGVAGRVYQVEANAHLNTTNWVFIGAATADVAGKFNFIDAEAPNFPARFYRLAIP